MAKEGIQEPGWGNEYEVSRAVQEGKSGEQAQDRGRQGSEDGIGREETRGKMKGVARALQKIKTPITHGQNRTLQIPLPAPVGEERGTPQEAKEEAERNPFRYRRLQGR